MSGASPSFPEHMTSLMNADTFIRDGERRLQRFSGATVWRGAEESWTDEKGRRGACGVSSDGRPWVLAERKDGWVLRLITTVERLAV